MLIKRASFRNLHGHITKDIEFNTDVNILTGINGSGKTTILNTLFWTLSPESMHGGVPAALHLGNLEFDEISITFTLPGIRKHQIVTARNDGDAIEISARDIESELSIPVLEDLTRTRRPLLNRAEENSDLITAHLNDERRNPILQYLRSLSGPLYLPLDRRWPGPEEPFRRRLRNRPFNFAGHLPINEVMWYIDRGRRQEQVLAGQLNDQLRNDLLTSLFKGLGTSMQSTALRANVIPIKALRDQRERILATFDLLGITDAEDETQSVFDRLEQTAQQLEGRNIREMQEDDPHYRAWVDWIVEGSPLVERIDQLVPLIEKYETEWLGITSPSRSFLAAVNSFLIDSRKILLFTEDDTLSVGLPGGEITDASNLSSGELQLLTLFAFLHFLFGQEDEFTIIIDEPELSLHLAWQSRYLEAVTQANPRAQFIVATHSPEIAAPFEERIIDISPQQEQ